MRTRLLLSVAIGLIALSSETPAHAQDASAAAAAERLFQEGRTLIEQGRWAEACPKLAESLRLDPAAGTSLNLAECYERIEKLASAWVTYRKAETLARRAAQRERSAHAAARAAALEAELSTLKLTVKDRPPGLVITRDGERLGEPAWGTPAPIDGGRHLLEASAPGRKPWRADVQIPVRRGAVTITIPDLAMATEAASTTPAREPPSSLQRTLGWVAVGTGAAALGVGFVFGAVAKSKYDDAELHCSPIDCDRTGVELTGDARSAASLSTVLVVAGGVVAATGVVLVLTAPSSSPATGANAGSFGVSLSPLASGVWATF
ncbi:MAG: hypothetical protein JST00_18405 [Deltaproteobacteria bacterium]|nr:hypothetical protein [Deltaproteobacteria bacterium]